MKKALTLFAIIALGIVSIQASAVAAVPENLAIEFWPEYDDGQILFIAAAEYSQNEPLPIEVKLPVPKGAQVTWSGEILGGPSAEDVRVIPKIETKATYDEISFTLNKSRRAQVEAKWAGIQLNGAARSIAWDWVPEFEAKSVQVGVKAPSQSSNVNMSPKSVKVLSGPDKLNYYVSAPTPLSSGQTQNYRVTYDRAASGPSVTPQQQQALQSGSGQVSGTGAPANVSADNSVIYALIAIGAGAIVFAVHALQKRKAAHDERSL